MMQSIRSKLQLKPKVATPLPESEWVFEAIGTQWWIGIYESTNSENLWHIKRLVAERIELFDVTYSRFRSDSLVSKVATQKGVYEFPDDAEALFALYRKLYDTTNMAVTPLIGQLLADSGYDTRYSLIPGALHVPPMWDEALDFADNTLTTSQPVLLDFGAAGKGYLVDIIAELMQSSGITRYCVDGGGDMVCHGLSEPLLIGLEQPNDVSKVIGVARLQDIALCGSAGNRRKWHGYTHIIDPFSLKSPHNIKAVWVMADNALTADGLATALFFAEPQQLLLHFNFEYAIVYADETVSVSSNFNAEIFT